jgi:polyisoprenoid-binding protein YceI
MKKVFMACASFVVIAATLSFTTITKQQQDAAIVYNVDAKTSKVDFSGSKKDGYHPGYFPVKTGVVNVANGKITGGKFTIDVAGVKVTDGAGEMLEGHLKKADFFDAEKFGEAVFEITSIKYKGTENAKVTGNLTLKGITAAISFDAKVRSIDEAKLFAEAFFTLDRTKFGMLYGVGKVSKDVQIGIHLFAAK